MLFRSVKIYRNSILVKTGNIANQLNTDGSTILTIGARANLDIFFKGYIDDFRIYNRVLTSSEISFLYNYNLYSTGINGAFVENITGTSLNIGIGGSGAPVTSSIPVIKSNYASGGDGNGGIGYQGVVIIKIPNTNSNLSLLGNYSIGSIDSYNSLNIYGSSHLRSSKIIQPNLSGHSIIFYFNSNNYNYSSIVNNNFNISFNLSTPNFYPYLSVFNKTQYGNFNTALKISSLNNASINTNLSSFLLLDSKGNEGTGQIINNIDNNEIINIY